MADAGKDVPAIRDRPSMIGDEWLWEGFMELNTCRPIGFSPGPIPWTAIDAYCRAEEFNEEQRWMFLAVIRHLDNIWLDHAAQKQAQTTPPSPRPKALTAQRR